MTEICARYGISRKMGYKTPASLYRPSRRTYDGRLPPFEYPGHFLVQRITNVSGQTTAFFP